MSKIHRNYRSIFVGLDTPVPVLDGQHVTYVSLDNAASTPAFLHVQKTVNDFLEY